MRQSFQRYGLLGNESLSHADLGNESLSHADIDEKDARPVATRMVRPRTVAVRVAGIRILIAGLLCAVAVCGLAAPALARGVDGGGLWGFVEYMLGDDDGYGYDDWDDAYLACDEQVDESELLSWNLGLGSCSDLDGNIVVVSIFADDDTTSWDFGDREDRAIRDDALTYLGIATDYIEAAGRQWGAAPTFIYDWQADPDLYYECALDCDVLTEDEDAVLPVDVLGEWVASNVDEDALRERYGADSIAYMTFWRTDWDNEVVSYSYPCDDTAPYDTEACFIMVRSYDEEESPAAYAHEMLHLFGAPDLYTSEYPAYNYNITNAFVLYCDEYYPNEIMNTTYDVDHGWAYYDHISNEVSGITAYYVGWTDECPEVDEFGLQPSQHITYYGRG